MTVILNTYIRTLVLAITLALLPFAGSIAKEDKLPAETTEKLKMAATMWASFKCSVLAVTAENRNEATRLFEVGYNAGQIFMKALHAGEFTKKHLRSGVPTVVYLSLQGPSADFVIGRLHAMATEDAMDAIVKKDGNNRVLPSDQWVTEKAVQKIKAEGAFLRANCELLR